MKPFTYVTAVFLAMALTFTSATQMRISGLPVGAGEILLVGWLLAITVEIVRRQQFAITPVTKWLGVFWYLSFSCLFIGCWIALSEGMWDATGFHDITAYLFIAVLFITLSIIHPLPIYMQVIAKWFLFFSFILILAMYLLAQVSGLGPISFWYWDRFTGWSTNPNQLALHITVAAWIGGYYFLNSSRLLKRGRYFIMVLGLALVGWATKSDSLLISWSSGIAIYATFRLIFGARPIISIQKRIQVSRWIRFLLVILVISIAFVGLYEPFMRAVENIYNDGHQGSLRFLLWENGLAAIAASPLFGLGPGAHSGRSGPFQGFEAHNTLIDWGGSVGILGVLVLFGLYVRSSYVCWKSNELYLLTAILMIFQFSLFHYVLRQPIFWFLMSWIITIPLSKASVTSRSL